jgi:hypothetical protein
VQNRKDLGCKRSGFDFSRGILSLSNKEVKSLENYLKITNLILECKDAAVALSRSSWEKIELRLLTLKP